MSSLPSGAAGPGITATDRMAHLVIIAVLCLIAVCAIVTATGFPAALTETDVGAARFPILYSAALIALSLILLVQTLTKPVVGAEPATTRPRYGMVAAAMVLMVIDFIVIDYLGYWPAALLLLAGLMLLLGLRSMIWTPVIAIIISVVVYLLFDYALNVPLPTGSLFE